MCWDDRSTIASRDYILITINVMFDVAAFFSAEEYYLKYGENVCVQSIVEKPSLCIIGKCLSNDQQLLYFHIRLEDISLIRENLETLDGIPVRDEMRIFIGDSPGR